jgi:hypothetical protein
MTTMSRDPIDAWSVGLLYEIYRELDMEFGGKSFSNVVLGERIEAHVLQAMEHECSLSESPLLRCALANRPLIQWYETNLSRYSDHFLEAMPQVEPYTEDPEKYANIWGNLTSQIIGAIYGNVREGGI